MPIATVTSKGQITIPKEVRDHLRLSSGDRLEFVVDPQGAVVLKPARRAARDLFGLLKRRTPSPVGSRELDAEIAGVIAEDHERIRRKR